MNGSLSIADLTGRVLDAYDTLASLGEDVEDEWSYVNDLSTVWRERIATVTSARAAEMVGMPVMEAVDRLIDEVGLITDPHRAIDWLSTFPQVLLLALGEQA